MRNKKGFIIILVGVFLAVLILTALAIMNMGASDLLQTKSSDDITKATYVAIAGAEKMYGRLKSMEGQTVTWPQAVPSADSIVSTRAAGGTVIGSFSANADMAGADQFGIVSIGTVNGRSARVTVRYGFTSDMTNGYPVGCMGNMEMYGRKFFIFTSRVIAEGPIATGGTFTGNNYVNISGGILQDQSFVTPSFWQSYDASTGTWSSKVMFDTNGNTEYVTDTTGKGYVDIADCGGDPAKEAIFASDDINNDGMIDDKDGFIAYYTVELNKQGLNIGVGQQFYYSGTQDFDPGDVPAGTSIIFVDGDVNIDFNDTVWWGGAVDHTIVATGDINILQPTNGSDDTLMLVAWGDVNTGGISWFGGISGDLVVYANQDFNAYFGGRSSGTIFAGGDVYVDTVLPIPGLLNRTLNRGTVDWSDPSNWPLGLPPNFNKISLNFDIKDEAGEFVPIWQRE